MRSLQIFSVLLAVVLFSCSNPSSNTEATSSTDIIPHSAITEREKMINEPIDTTPVIEDTIYFPRDTSYPFSILQDGGPYHGSQVPESSELLNWFGLFKSKTGYYIQHTDIRIDDRYDPIIDDDDTTLKSGNLITVLHKDTPVMLISGPELPERSVISLVTPQNFIHPEDDTIRFDFKGVSYKLYCTAIRKFDGIDPGYYSYWNYKLYLSGSKKGKEITQLLRATARLQYEQILFIGDLDGDGIPDMIFNLGGENFSAPTLYLSKGGKEGELLKVVAQWETSGC